METAETKVLAKAIEKYITKKIDLVKRAQFFAKKISDAGFISALTLPFQILPTEISDSDGDLICKIFLNLENPIYGYFSIEMFDNNCAITCPHIYNRDYFISTYEDLDIWLDTLSSEMDIFYKLQSANDQIMYCEIELNALLMAYKGLIRVHLAKIEDYIKSDERIAIYTGGVYALAKDAKKDFARALLIPSAWIVFKDLDSLPDDGEAMDDYIDEDATNLLLEKLNEFFKIEGYLSAPLYLGQRVIMQGGLGVEGLSLTEEDWVKASSGETGDFVLPVIDLEKFRIV